MYSQICKQSEEAGLFKDLFSCENTRVDTVYEATTQQNAREVPVHARRLSSSYVSNKFQSRLEACQQQVKQRGGREFTLQVS